MGSAIFLVALTSVGRAQPCRIETVVQAAERAGPRATLEAIEPLRVELEAAAACAPAAQPDQLARFWLAQGALLWVADRQEEARAALASAARLAPERSEPAYGPDFEALRVGSMGRASGSAELTLSGAPSPWRVLVDGAPWDRDPLTDGWHLVQVVDPRQEAASWARLHYLAAGEGVVLTVEGLPPLTPVPAAEPAPIARATTRTRERARGPLVWGGLAAEVVAVGCAAYARSLHGDIVNAPTLARLDAVYARQRTAAGAAVGLAGAGAVTLGWGVVLGARVPP